MSSTGRQGVLLINLGSPRAPTAEALREYLAEFLGDPCVVDWPRWIWWPILHGIILRTRPAKSAKLYERVWTDAGSPLVATSCSQAQGLQDALGEGWVVRSGMRYGSPSIREARDQLAELGATRIHVLPMFPQDSLATTVTAERVIDTLRDSGPELNWLGAYPDHPAYLGALAAVMRRAAAESEPDHYVFSFHGIPARWVRNGSPYREHCERTARGLAQALELGDEQWTLVFQSKFGPERWLEPAADELVPKLAERFPSILAACPGFTSDCLETTDEIGRELAEDFLEAGGKRFELAPCLNAAPEWIEAMATMVREAAR